jgi:hypothetical protein
MPSSILAGDLNNDVAVNLTDAILAGQIMAGINPPVAVYKQADVNGDDKIGMEEMVFILQKIAGIR